MTCQSLSSFSFKKVTDPDTNVEAAMTEGVRAVLVAKEARVDEVAAVLQATEVVQIEDVQAIREITEEAMTVVAS